MYYLRDGRDRRTYGQRWYYMHHPPHRKWRGHKNWKYKKKAPTPELASSEAKILLPKAIDNRVNPLKVSAGRSTTPYHPYLAINKPHFNLKSLSGGADSEGVQGDWVKLFDTKFHFHRKFWVNLITFGYPIYPKYSHPYSLHYKLFKNAILLTMNVGKIVGWDANTGDQIRTAFCRVWSGSTLFAQACLSEYVE